LRAVGQTGKLSRGDAAAAEQAFGQIQRLRLDLQVEALKSGDRPPGNVTRPACLNEFEHRVLKESFRQARRLQQQMKTAFNLEA
jgi:CBS domain-containing protein